MNYENYTKEDWSELDGHDWNFLLQRQPQFSEHCDWSKLDGWDGWDWSCLLRKQPQFSEHCDWSKLDGWGWSCLLHSQPQFSEHCDWSKLDGWDWNCLLRHQPQFSEHCGWSKLDGEDWSFLLRHQPQFSEHCKTYVFSHDCGTNGRIIFIDKSKPEIIHIGCFSGTKEEAITAINNKYSGDGAKNYIAKVEECFGKLISK